MRNQLLISLAQERQLKQDATKKNLPEDSNAFSLKNFLFYGTVNKIMNK